MSFLFHVTDIVRLTRAKVGVIRGLILEGAAATDANFELVHAGLRIPLQVKDIVAGLDELDRNALCICAPLHQPAMDVIAVGDKLGCFDRLKAKLT